jgi:hypothetical protein
VLNANRRPLASVGGAAFSGTLCAGDFAVSGHPGNFNDRLMGHGSVAWICDASDF